jgi:diadenosine tetraphosphatase ApaH/serine/threonine PP2A family protein phosphatase
MQPVYELPLPSWIVGDIHGNFHDLIRVFVRVRDLADQHIVFLGDYVDRGQYSLDCILLLLTVMCEFPRSITLLRGNHEFSCVNNHGGFKEEIEARFPESHIWERCNALFSRLPFAACLGDIAVCLHGGIGPHCTSLSAIQHIVLPVDTYQGGDIVSEIVWSDPIEGCEGFVASDRGMGVRFGSFPVMCFLKDSGFSRLFRGHECVPYGFSVSGSCTTVFSASNYCDRGNTAAIAYLAENGHVDVKLHKPILGLLPRDQAKYTPVQGLKLQKFPLVPSSMSRSKLIAMPKILKANDVRTSRKEVLKGLLEQGSFPSLGRLHDSQGIIPAHVIVQP